MSLYDGGQGGGGMTPHGFGGHGQLHPALIQALIEALGAAGGNAGAQFTPHGLGQFEPHQVPQIPTDVRLGFKGHSGVGGLQPGMREKMLQILMQRQSGNFGPQVGIPNPGFGN